MSLPGKIILGCWLLFLCIWVVLAFGNKRTIQMETMVQRLSYSLPMLLGLALILHWPRGRGLSALLYAPGLYGSPALRWIAALLAVGGLVLAIWARLTLGRNWSGTVTLKQDHELVTRGPYAWVRHPIYSALALLILALVLPTLSPGTLIGFTVIMASFWIKLRAEERVMLARFPDSYPVYMKRCKRLVPYIL